MYDLNKANVKCMDSFRDRKKKQKTKMKGEVCFGNWEEDKKRCKEEGANKVLIL